MLTAGISSLFTSLSAFLSGIIRIIIIARIKAVTAPIMMGFVIFGNVLLLKYF